MVGCVQVVFCSVDAPVSEYENITKKLQSWFSLPHGSTTCAVTEEYGCAGYNMLHLFDSNAQLIRRNAASLLIGECASWVEMRYLRLCVFAHILRAVCECATTFFG